MPTIGRPLKSTVPAKGRRVVSGRRDTFTGYVPSTKEGNDHRLIAYESILERDYIQLLEDDRNVVAYRDRDRAYSWIGPNGRRRIYRPDFTLELLGGRRICVEVKPHAKLQRKDRQAHYAMIGRQMVDTHGFDEFRLVTDRDIRRPVDLYNAELRQSARVQRLPLMNGDFAIRQVMYENGSMSVGDLRSASHLGSRSFWAVLTVLTGGSIRASDGSVPIEDSTLVEWADEP